MIHKSFNVINEDIADVYDTNCCMMLYNNQSYENLEYLGDRAISMPILDYVLLKFNGKHTIHSTVGIYSYRKNSHKTEGYITKIASNLERKEQLAEFGRVLRLNEYILLSSHEERINGRNNVRLLEDTFESFMGALYLDQGFDACKVLMMSLIDQHVDINDIINNPTNFKDMLLKYFHKMKWSYPVYNNLENTTTFISYIKISSSLIEVAELGVCKDNLMICSEKLKNQYGINTPAIVLGVGSGSTKKNSEQSCSKTVLQNLNVEFTL
jgi:dsRNA-specific ribonuclease